MHGLWAVHATTIVGSRDAPSMAVSGRACSGMTCISECAAAHAQNLDKRNRITSVRNIFIYVNVNVL